MTVTHQWHNDNIMVVTLIAPWTWEEYMPRAQQMFDEIRRAGRSVATVVNVSAMGGLPPGSMLKRLQQMNTMLPDNLDASVIVGAPYVVKAVMNVFAKVNPRARRLAVFASTFEEALTLIEQRRAKA